MLLTGRRPWGWREAYWLGVLTVFALGATERFVIYTRALPVSSDEAMSPLMASQLWHGHVSAFLWGQHFGGTAEVVPLAVVTRLLPASQLAERSVTIVLGGVAAYLGGRIGSRLGGPIAGLLAGTVLWAWPPYFVAWSMHEYLYYEPVITLGLAALWWGIRTWERPADLRFAVLIGVAGGLAWWTNPQAAEFAVPVFLALARIRAHRLTRVVAAIAGAAVGAGPWIVDNLARHLASLDSASLDQHLGYAARLAVVFRDGAAVAFGLERPTQQWLGPWAHPVFWVVLGAAGAAVVRAGVMWRGRAIEPPVDMVGLALYPFTVALLPAIGMSPWSPRYFFFAWPWLAFAAARLATISGKEAASCPPPCLTIPVPWLPPARRPVS